jgi:hypothetical protein
MAVKLDFSQLRKVVQNQARKFLAECQQQVPTETFYGLAFCVDSDVQSLYCQTNSEETLENPGNRFFINEWHYNDNQATEANRALAAVWDAFQAGVDEEEADKRSGQVRKDCLKAIVQGLQDFRKSDALPKSARNDFALLVYDPDPDDPEETKAMAKQQNSRKTYAAFIDPDNGFLYA